MSCLLCNLALDEYETCVVKLRGLKTIIACSIDRKDNIADSLQGLETITVHVDCRKNYTSRKYNGKLVKFSTPDCRQSEGNVKFQYVPITIQNTSTPKAKKPKGSKAAFNTVIAETPVENALSTDTTVPDNDYRFGMTNFENMWDNAADAAEYRPESNEISGTAHQLMPVEGDSSNFRTNDSTELKYFPCVEDSTTNVQIYVTPELDFKQKTADGELSSTSKDEEDPTKPFPFQHKCLFCAKDIGEEYIKAESRKPISRRNQVCYVSRESTQMTMMREITRISNIPTSQINLIKFKFSPSTVLKRIKDVDLLQEKAGYHTKCYKVLFHYSLTQGCKKRRECPLLMAAMEKTCRYIDESDRTEFTSKELTSASLHGENQPEWRTIQRKLKMKYGDRIFFTSVPGRSTIITVLKGAGSSGNMFAQPWNLNSIDLGGQIEENLSVQRRKGKYVKKPKTLRETHRETNEENLKEEMKEDNGDKRKYRKKPKTKETDRKVNEENLEEEMNEDNGDDFIDDTFNSEDNTIDVKRNLSTCRICFSSDRKLDDLGEYCDVLQKICSDIFIQDFDSKIFLLCWECKALLKNVKGFQEKILTAQNYWNSEIQAGPTCLSTLSITTPATASVSYTTENEDAMQNETTQEYVKPEMVAVDVLPDDLNLPLIEDQKDTIEENNMNDDTFDYDTKDMNSDDDSEDLEMSRKTLKMRKSKGITKKRKVSSDSDQDLEQNEKKNDPDWGEPVAEKSYKKKTKKIIELKIPYTIIVQTYVTETKMKREPIERYELNNWLDTEKNSTYFQSLDHEKCMKCISEVPENHDELCHSKAYSYVCEICESTFPSEGELDSHVAGHYYIFRCELCPYKCYNETHMRGHVESHRRLVQCLECFAAFETFDILKEHFNQLHRYAECDYCGKQFPRKRMLETHIERSHTPHVCPICNKSYGAYSHKMHHMNLKHRVERTEAAYCVQCDIQFDNEALLKRHVYSSYKHKHEWKREPAIKVKQQYKCPDCPNVYASKLTMRGHYNLVHAKKITFYCKYCDKAFPTKNSYKTHMRYLHEGFKLPKNKFCHICGRGFSTNKILNNHVRTHTGERPYACALCPARFAQNSALASHKRTLHRAHTATE